MLVQSLTLILSLLQRERRIPTEFELRFSQRSQAGHEHAFALDIRRSMFDVRRLFMASSWQILGIRFFNGDVDEAVASMFHHRGFLVAPSGTCFARLREDEYIGAPCSRPTWRLPTAV